MRPARSADRMPRALGALGVALVILGVILWTTAPDSFGWFSYEPVDEQVLSRMLFMSGQRWWGVASLVTGLLLVAGVVGYRLGHARGSAESD